MLGSSGDPEQSFNFKLDLSKFFYTFGLTWNASTYVRVYENAEEDIVAYLW